MHCYQFGHARTWIFMSNLIMNFTIVLSSAPKKKNRQRKFLNDFGQSPEADTHSVIARNDFAIFFSAVRVKKIDTLMTNPRPGVNRNTNVQDETPKANLLLCLLFSRGSIKRANAAPKNIVRLTVLLCLWRAPQKRAKIISEPWLKMNWRRRKRAVRHHPVEEVDRRGIFRTVHKFFSHQPARFRSVLKRLDRSMKRDSRL